MPSEACILFLSLGSVSSAHMLKEKLGPNTHYLIEFAYEAAKVADKQKI